MSDEYYKKRDDGEDDEKPSNQIEDEDQTREWQKEDLGPNSNLNKAT